MTAATSDKTMEYTFVIEQTPKNIAAYAPDHSGCVGTGATQKEVVQELRSAIAFHIEGLCEHDEPIPIPQCATAIADVIAAE